MKNKNLIKFVESFILLPALTMSGASLGNNIGSISHSVIGIAENIRGTPSAIEQQSNAGDLVRNDVLAQKQKVKADAIDSYFKKYNMPLYGMGMKMVLEAEKNGLDWRLLAAITVRESTGGKFACKTVGYNAFGWGSCKIGFSSNEEAIERIALHLGGNHPKTEKYYSNKTTIGILHSYNPPSIVPRYAEQVISIMNAIGSVELTPAPLAIANA
ncbi:hypothetical protein A3H53_01400 [Candidatus Nomurabacteria bacterium RIFCSPLOWO2_02_FULL_40_10]|uniref:Mannosyl-glycoprotein endo-beta-N-acetylglucosamidase-like domain-containing protein n=2 Tax=Candidatus Nomuraibacteriota TaxID=1752729 RepID=A0A1F6XZZ6_9BACT|nr:MAG: hypothetical protein A2642_02385 [Candidatus Nomurabacteria bacterium RIFCSPHIGHO2_01_FULL_39_10]OGI99699.1 MAG: hypothetical protein A3H53_01400 [Candidatus Nomurabacteria bacterium RIFCSPLOWO2_02_FULL_40_10]